MDLATVKEWLGVLAPYAGIAVTIWLGLHVKNEVNGRMTEFKEALLRLSDAREVAIRAEVLEPANVAAARAIVVADERAVHDAEKNGTKEIT